jgi:chaperone modulatory protein CbpM
MTDLFSEDDTILAIAWLNLPRLHAFVTAELITPLQTAAGPRYRPVDLARLQLLCDLAEEFDVTEDTLAILMSLIDKLHAARSRLISVAEALEAEPPEVRLRVGARILAASRGR